MLMGQVLLDIHKEAGKNIDSVLLDKIKPARKDSKGNNIMKIFYKVSKKMGIILLLFYTLYKHIYVYDHLDKSQTC